MDMIDQVAAAVPTILTQTAADLGRSTGFVQRESKLRGATFVQTLVCTYLANPDATLAALTQTAAALGVTISAPGLDQRFTEEAAQLLQQVLAAALTHLLACASHERWDLPILTQFPHVFLEDSTQIALPAALRSMWAGTNDTDAHPDAMLKLCLRLDVLTGLLDTRSVHPGRCHESQAAAPSDTIPPGALSLADLGFFALARLVSIAAAEAFFLSRFTLHTQVWTADGRCWSDLTVLLDAQQCSTVDLPVRVGKQQAVTARLVAVRAPQEVVDQRRRLRQEARRRRRRPPSAAALAACAWTCSLTNVPPERLAVQVVLVIARVRWQIALVFRTWKSHGLIDQSRSQQPWRVLCDVFAKLLAMIISHGIQLTDGWGYPDRSLVKATLALQPYAMALAIALVDGVRSELVHLLRRIAQMLRTSCRMNPRKTKPNTYQTVIAIAEHLP